MGRPTSGAIAFMVDMPDGQTVATTLGGGKARWARSPCSAPRVRPSPRLLA